MARRHSRLVGMSMDRKRIRRQMDETLAADQAATAKFLRARHDDPMVRAADDMYAALGLALGYFASHATGDNEASEHFRRIRDAMALARGEAPASVVGEGVEEGR